MRERGRGQLPDVEAELKLHALAGHAPYLTVTEAVEMVRFWPDDPRLLRVVAFAAEHYGDWDEIPLELIDAVEAQMSPEDRWQRVESLGVGLVLDDEFSVEPRSARQLARALRVVGPGEGAQTVARIAFVAHLHPLPSGRRYEDAVREAVTDVVVDWLSHATVDAADADVLRDAFAGTGWTSMLVESRLRPLLNRRVT